MGDTSRTKSSAAGRCASSLIFRHDTGAIHARVRKIVSRKNSLQEILIGLMRDAQKFLRGAAAKRTGSLPHCIDDRGLFDDPRGFILSPKHPGC